MGTLAFISLKLESVSKLVSGLLFNKGRRRCHRLLNKRWPLHPPFLSIKPGIGVTRVNIICMKHNTVNKHFWKIFPFYCVSDYTFLKELGSGHMD
jgi:hypothetical protein